MSYKIIYQQLLGAIIGFISFVLLLLLYISIVFYTILSQDTTALIYMGGVGFLGFIASLILVFQKKRI